MSDTIMSSLSHNELIPPFGKHLSLKKYLENPLKHLDIWIASIFANMTDQWYFMLNLKKKKLFGLVKYTPKDSVKDAALPVLIFPL